MLHFAVAEAFDDLLCAWRNHQQVVSAAATDVPTRARARDRLDRARRRMHALRTALHPEAAELAAVIDTIWCEQLDAVVHLRWSDRDARWPGRLRCPCGSAVDIDWDRAESTF